MMRNVAINTIQRKGNSTWIHYGTENFKKLHHQNMGTYVGSELCMSSLLRKSALSISLVNLRSGNGTHTITKAHLLCLM